MNPGRAVERIAVAVIVRGCEVLLVRRRVPEGTLSWQFPGGKAAPGESAADAAVRETAEETGAIVVVWRVLGERVHPVTGKRVTYVACDLVSGTPHVAAPREIDAVEWVPIGDLHQYVPDGFSPVVQEYLDAVLAS